MCMLIISEPFWCVWQPNVYADSYMEDVVLANCHDPSLCVWELVVYFE